MRWNSETKARLIEPWERGLSIGSIFQRVGRTPSTVKSQASKLRLRRQTGDRSRFAPVTADVKICCTVTDDLQLLSLWSPESMSRISADNSAKP